MQSIPIGTLVRGTDDPGYRIRQLAPLGFECFSIMYWQTASISDTSAFVEQINQAVESTGSALSSLSVYGNVLDPSQEGRQTLDSLRLLIELAALLSVPLVSCFAGRVPGTSVPDSLERWKEVFTPLIDRAGELGLRIAFENCRLGDTWKQGKWNIAINEDAWEMMFSQLPSPVLGLEWEPSHQVEMFVDPIAQLERWLPHILHIHGKDSRIDHRMIARNGLYGARKWHQSCFPGFGDTDWKVIFELLHQGGYRGTVDIEGWNDAVYSGKREMEGQLAALSYLKAARDTHQTSIDVKRV